MGGSQLPFPSAGDRARAAHAARPTAHHEQGLRLTGVVTAALIIAPSARHGTGRRRRRRKQTIERGTVQITAVQHHALDRACRTYVLEWIALEQQQVRFAAGLDRPVAPLQSEEPGSSE